MRRFPVAAAAVACCALMLLAGCDSAGEEDFKPVAEDQPPVEIDLHEHGPHDGHIIDIGDHDYRGELVMDADRNLTIYLLQHDSQDPLMVDPQGVSLQLEIEGQMTPVELEPVVADGKASEFRLPAANVPAQAKTVEDLEGELKVTVDEKEFTGALEHHHHE